MIYILVQDYPSQENSYAMMYVHSRNLIYQERGLKFKVVSMSAKKQYQYEGVQIISKKDFNNIIEENRLYNDDVLVSHAPNLRNHLPLINSIFEKIKKVVVFFHGHEVLKTQKYYPENYSFIKKNFSEDIWKASYDFLKLRIMSRFLKRLHQKNKLKVICVSNWMKTEAGKCLNIDLDEFDTSIINNNANEIFFKQHYKKEEHYAADFITIRPLDASKYGIDLIVKFAQVNPHYSFHIYGKGEYFSHYRKPNNIEVINEFLPPMDIPNLLNSYKCALMPTRLDAQGVMACEMATHGIPVITSDLDVCKEMFTDFSNVKLVNDEFWESCFSDEESFFRSSYEKNYKFSIRNTVEKEIIYLKEILTK